MIASLIKRFFYNLKVPLIPFKHFEQLMKDQSLNNIKDVVKDLPRKNYITLVFLLDFLIKDVISKEESNKMSAYNLAVCFSQSLMRSEVPSMADIERAKLSVAVTNTMIVSFEDIFGEEEDRKKLFRKRVLEQKK